MQEKWNQFVYVLCEAKKKDVDEDTYHQLIENQLQLLGWAKYKGEICHKHNVPIGNSKFIQPDILIRDGEDDLFVIEVKRPVHQQTERERVQLESYMRQLKIDVGIYIGEHIEVFYDRPKSKDAVSVLSIPLEIDNKLGTLFAKEFCKENFTKEAIIDFCEERIKEMQRQASINKIRESLIAEAQAQISESLIPYLTEKYNNAFSEKEIEGMLATIRFSAVVSDASKDIMIPALKLQSPVIQSNQVKCFLTRNADAQGIFDTEEHSLIVLKGSRINPKLLSKTSESGRKRHKLLIEEYTELKKGERIVKEDVKFASPSGAAFFCVGGSSNGWTEWKDENGSGLNIFRNYNSLDTSISNNKNTIITDTKRILLDYWTKFRDKILALGIIPSLPAPHSKAWYDLRIGRSGIVVSNSCNTKKNVVSVKVYIRNKYVNTYFLPLMARKIDINKKLGCEPVWDANPKARDKTIAIKYKTDFSDPQKVEDALDWMVKHALVFKEVFAKEVKDI